MIRKFYIHLRLLRKHPFSLSCLFSFFWKKRIESEVKNRRERKKRFLDDKNPITDKTTIKPQYQQRNKFLIKLLSIMSMKETYKNKMFGLFSSSQIHNDNNCSIFFLARLFSPILLLIYYHCLPSFKEKWVNVITLLKYHSILTLNIKVTNGILI